MSLCNAACWGVKNDKPLHSSLLIFVLLGDILQTVGANYILLTVLHLWTTKCPFPIKDRQTVNALEHESEQIWETCKYVYMKHFPSGTCAALGCGKCSLFFKIYNRFWGESFKEQGDLQERLDRSFNAFLRWTLINSLIRAVSCKSDLLCSSINLLSFSAAGINYREQTLKHR